MKKGLWFIFKFSFLILLVQYIFISSGYGELSRLHVDGKYIKTSNGKKVILQGVSLAEITFLDWGSDQKWNIPNCVEMIDRMTDTSKGWYTNIIRLPIHAEDSKDFGYRWTAISHDEFYTKHLRPAVDRCKQRGVYCVIDWHYVNNTYGTDKDGQSIDEKTKEFWSYIAPKFAKDDHVLFEVFNEPRDKDRPKPRWAETKSHLQPWVDTIRKYANNIILVGGPMWCGEIGDSAENPVKGKNIVYVSHIYPETDHNWQQEEISNAVHASTKAPVILGEFGWDQDSKDMKPDINPDYLKQLKEMCQSHDMGWICWSATPDWYPGLLQKDWLNIKTGPGYTGEFLQAWMLEQYNKNNQKTK